MKFTGNRAQLASAAKWVARAIPRNPATPILAGMVLEATDDGLRLSAFDYDLSLSATVEGATSDAGRVVVPGLVLAGFLSAAKGKDADLIVGDNLTIRSGSASSEAPHEFYDRDQERVLAIVRAWHNDVHRYGFEQCDQQPCHAINRPAG